MFHFFIKLSANYEITRRLCSLPVCQTTSYLVLTCRFLNNFVKILTAVNVLMTNLLMFRRQIPLMGSIVGNQTIRIENHSDSKNKSFYWTNPYVRMKSQE